MLDLAGAVQRGRLSQLCGNRLEIGSCQDHIPYIKSSRKQDRPDGIHQMQVVDQDEGRDHPAAEKHRDHKNNIKEFPSHELFLGHGVCRKQRDKNGDHRKGHRIEKGISKASPYHIIFQHSAVGVYSPVFKIKADPLIIQYIGIHKGGQHHVYQRNKDRQDKQAQQRIASAKDRTVGFPQLHFPSRFHNQIPLL